MEGSAFDGWTRRRFGRLTGGVVATFLGLPAAAGARKRRRKKRCKNIHALCTPGGKRRCCRGLRCDKTIGDNPALHCCTGEGASCDDHLDCCDGLGCPDETCVPLSSDRNLKSNFASGDPADVLERVRALPIATWNDTSDDPSVRHIGPMAQDFSAAFGVGADDRHLHPIDGQGVALAAIQGLVLEVERLRTENGELATRVAGLESSRQLAGR